MAINNITQTISTIPEAAHRGVDVQTAFVIKQEDFQDHLQGITVDELNTFKDQLNSRIGEINSTTTTMNGYASTASAGASTATTKAGEASTSAGEALSYKNQAETFKNNASASATKASQWADNNYNVEVEAGRYSAKHWSTVAQNTLGTKVDKVTSTDNAIVRFDGTTGAVQNSGVVIDDAGNVGVGVTPYPWFAGNKAIDFGGVGNISSDSSIMALRTNSYFNGVNNIYKTNGYASFFYQDSGSFQWFTAPSGTAGNVISWTNVMTLDSTAGYVSPNTTFPKFTVGDRNGSVDKVISMAYDVANDLGLVYSYRNNYGARPLALNHFGGNVLIGTTIDNGVDKLQVNGSASISGNVGIGTTPSAWAVSHKAIQLPGGGSLYNNGATSGYINLASNNYYDGSNWRYINDAGASNYIQVNGSHYWSVAPIGTVGSPITWSTAMTIDSAGNLGLGTTPSNWSSTIKSMDILNNSFLSTSSGIHMTKNAYYNNGWKYKTTDYAGDLSLDYDGSLVYSTATSGTAGGTVSWNGKLKVTNAGNLLLGTNIDNGVDKLQVNGSISASNVYNETSISVLIPAGATVTQEFSLPLIYTTYSVKAIMNGNNMLLHAFANYHTTDGNIIVGISNKFIGDYAVGSIDLQTKNNLPQFTFSAGDGLKGQCVVTNGDSVAQNLVITIKKII